MTVEQLIEKLKKFDPSLKVLISDSEYGTQILDKISLENNVKDYYKNKIYPEAVVIV